MKNDLGTRRKYQIKIKYPLKEDSEWCEVIGYGVAIAGFEEFLFFVHRSQNSFEKGWRISEETTGYAFPQELDAKTRQGVIDNVTKFLKRKGKDKFIRALEQVPSPT